MTGTTRQQATELLKYMEAGWDTITEMANSELGADGYLDVSKVEGWTNDVTSYMTERSMHIACTMFKVVPILAVCPSNLKESDWRAAEVFQMAYSRIMYLRELINASL